LKYADKLIVGFERLYAQNLPQTIDKHLIFAMGGNVPFAVAR
jgi:hypothetical protein